MTQRVSALMRYFLRSLLFSLAGFLCILLALVCWWVFFDPRQTTPHMDYYILMLSILGAAFTILVTLAIAAHANRAIHYPWLVRLHNRVEYLVAVLISSLCLGTLLQLLVAVLATHNGPRFTVEAVLQMPLIWLPVNALAAVLALHASDMCAVGWSRVYLFGSLLTFYFGQKINVVGPILRIVFWPFGAIADAMQTGSFRPILMAMGIVLLYAAVLLKLVIELFVAKDLDLTE